MEKLYFAQDHVQPSILDYFFFQKVVFSISRVVNVDEKKHYMRCNVYTKKVMEREVIVFLKPSEKFPMEKYGVIFSFIHS
jgi:hypothetical protein